MANLQIRLTTFNLILGVLFVVVALAVFGWLLPMFMPPMLIQTIAGVAIGILAWFLFLLSRS
jgi:hypothetical protein